MITLISIIIAVISGVIGYCIGVIKTGDKQKKQTTKLGKFEDKSSCRSQRHIMFNYDECDDYIICDLTVVHGINSINQSSGRLAGHMNDYLGGVWKWDELREHFRVESFELLTSISDIAGELGLTLEDCMKER